MNEVSIIINGGEVWRRKKRLDNSKMLKVWDERNLFRYGEFCDIFGYHLIFKKKEEDNINNK